MLRLAAHAIQHRTHLNHKEIGHAVGVQGAFHIRSVDADQIFDFGRDEWQHGFEKTFLLIPNLCVDNLE